MSTNNEKSTNSVIYKSQQLYESNVKPVIGTILQFVLWYMSFHTAYWVTEQLRFKWCVPCGFSGYIQTLIVSQSILCKLLTVISKTMADQQITTITMLSSFIGLKYVFSSNKQEVKETEILTI